MPKHFTVTLADGSTIEREASLDEDQLSRMTPEEVSQVLTGFLDVTCLLNAQVLDPIARIEKERLPYEATKFEAWRDLLLGGVVAAALIGLWIFLKVKKYSLLVLFGTFLAIAGIAYCLFRLVMALVASAACARHFRQTEPELQRLNTKKEELFFGTYLDYLVTGRAILPDYFCNETALKAMIAALQSHRVLTLAQAVALYESSEHYIPPR